MISQYCTQYFAKCDAARCLLTANCSAKWKLDGKLVALRKKRVGGKQ
ncbi:MAG: hypothetical protein ACUZ8A_06375 [Candidatus Bathyanammoxibius sp.]